MTNTHLLKWSTLILLSVGMSACAVKMKNGTEAEIEESATATASAFGPATIQITDTSPTLNDPLSLAYGASSGSYVHYCIQENITTVGTCSWVLGTLPTTYSPATTEGTVTLSAWVKSVTGEVSSRIFSNTVTADRVAPQVASFSITNTSPTKTTPYSLSYGAVTGTYADYCIRENNIAVAGCVWTSGAVPATIAVAATENDKTLSLWLRDTAGNVSTRRDTNTVRLDTTNPTITLNSLTGGQTIGGGSSTSITWTGADTNPGATPIKIEVSSDSGSNWSVLSATEANDGTYTWTVPSVNSTTYRVRLTFTDAATNTATSSSASDFTISSTTPVVTVTSPNGGEIWKGGSSKNITWTSSSLPPGASTAEIEYSIDGGSTWTQIVASVANGASNTYAWNPLPSVNEADARIRVTVTDILTNDTADTSDSNFTIDSTNPVVAITSPNGGEILTGGGSANVQYTITEANLGATPVLLEVSDDSGSTWSTLASGVSGSAGANTYTWNPVPSVTSKLYRVRATVTDAAGNVSTADASNADFWINSTTPTVTVTAPNGGEFIKGGAATNITWTSSGLPAGAATVELEYSVDSGSSWTQIATGEANDGTYSWTVPSVDDADVRVRASITDSYTTVTRDTSNANFTVDSTAPTLSLTSLTGGQFIVGNSTYAITWTASDTNFGTTPIDLKVSSNSGGAYSDIVTSEGNDGTYTWSTPSVDSATYRVRVIATDRAGNTTTVSSTSNFEIVTTDATAPTAATALALTNPTDGTTSSSPTASITGTMGTDSGASANSTNLTVKIYLNDNTCAVGNLVGTVAAAPGANFSLTTDALTAGGDGLKTLYYTIGDSIPNTRACAATGLDYTYQASPIVSFTQMGYTVKETGVYVGTGVSLQRDVCGSATTVTITTTAVSAMSTTNFTAGTEDVTFAAADCGTKTIAASEFTIANDGATTGDLFFRAAITSITGGTAHTKNQVAQVNIVDSALTADYMFNQPLYTADAGATSVTLIVQRAGSTVAASSVDVSFMDATAIAGTDYTGTTQTVNFGIGDDEETISVPITPGATNRSFIAKLVNASTGRKMRNISVAKVRILNDATACNTAGAPFGGGDGSTGDPYIICTLTQLKQVPSNLTKTFKMTKDVASDGTLVTFGTLTGNFDGNERIIDNYRFNGNASQSGLIRQATTGSYIKGINLMNVSVVNANSMTGGLLGYLNVPTTALFPAVTNNLVSGYVSGTSRNGMVIGYIQTAASGSPTITLTNNLSFGTVTGSSTQNGGTVGYVWPNATTGTNTYTFTNLINAANVIGTNNGATGGVIGHLQYYDDVTMTGAENRGYVYGGASNVGGIIGTDSPYNVSSPTETITNAINYGTVKGALDGVGGIIGRRENHTTATLSGLYNYGTIIAAEDQVGGLIGFNYYGNTGMSFSLSNSANYGPVSGLLSVGGVMGQVFAGTAIKLVTISIDTSSNHATVTGSEQVGGIIGAMDAVQTGAAPTGNAYSVTNSYNTGAVSATVATAKTGGLIGLVNGSLAADMQFTVSDSYSTGNVSCPSVAECGGLIGRYLVNGTKTSSISNSYAAGDVSGAQYLGGLIGTINMTSGASTLNLTDVYATGDVESTVANFAAAGGLIGRVANSTGTFLLSKAHATGAVTAVADRAGGLIGHLGLSGAAASNTVEKSYATGAVVASEYAGGLFGQIGIDTATNSVTINDSYSSGPVTVATGTVGGIAGYLLETGAITCTVNLSRSYSTSILTTTSGSIGGIYGSVANCTANYTESYWLKDAGMNAGIADDTRQRPVYDLQNLIGQGTPTYTGWDFTAGGPWNAFVPGTYPTLR